jgi:ABC-type transport system involved in multi-copper enzyme maturation permease subunit
MSASPLIPYWTFGEDHLVVKDIGYDTIMLAAVIFGALAASMFVSEEIEGRTAITLMSKPVSRRQFLLGKFVGIVLAAGVMFALLGTYFEGVLLFKSWWDRLDPQPTPEWLTSTLTALNLPGESTDLLRGVGLWTSHTLETLPGLVLAFSQVMVLVAIAVSLATRVPMVVNLATVLVIFFLAHLTPVLVTVAHNAQLSAPGSTVSQLLAFAAQLLDTILPNLDSFRIDPALLGDAAPPPVPFTKYVASLSLYGLLYTGIALLFGLILFEERDLA